MVLNSASNIWETSWRSQSPLKAEQWTKKWIVADVVNGFVEVRLWSFYRSSGSYWCLLSSKWDFNIWWLIAWIGLLILYFWIFCVSISIRFRKFEHHKYSIFSPPQQGKLYTNFNFSLVKQFLEGDITISPWMVVIMFLVFL